MAKAKKKSSKKASEIFHNILKPSVKGNPKPAKKKKGDGKIKISDLTKADSVRNLSDPPPKSNYVINTKPKNKGDKK